jgi:hypothetical protein
MSRVIASSSRLDLARNTFARSLLYFHHGLLARISRQFSAAAADPGMSTVLRSVGLLDIQSRLPAGPSEVSIFTLGAKRQAPCPSAPPRYGNCSENSSTDRTARVSKRIRSLTVAALSNSLYMRHWVYKAREGLVRNAG